MGIAATVDEPNHGAIPGHEVFAELAHLSPAPHHLLLRMSISVDENNRVLIDPLKRALQACKDADFEPWLVLHGGIEQRYQSLRGSDYDAAMPNAVLGLDNDMLLNDYINKFSLTCEGTLRDLGDLCPKVVWIWNEPANDGPSLVSGQRPRKKSSLSPHNFGALLAKTSERLRDKVPAVETILVGALACNYKFKTDPAGPWVGGFMRESLKYMNGYGVNPPYNFSGISLNMEGIFPEGYAEWCRGAIGKLMLDFKMIGPCIVSECGLPNGTIDDDNLDMTGTVRGLSTWFDKVFWYCYLTEKPSGDPRVYGLSYWGIDPNGFIVPSGHTPMYDRLKEIIAGL